METHGLREETKDFTEEDIDGMIKESWKEKDIKKIDDIIAESEGKTEKAAIVRKLAYIPLSLIDPNIEQTRRILFEDEKEFTDMVESVKAHGDVKRPIIVIPFKKRFMLKDGQRRLIASKIADIEKIFSIIEYAVDKSGRPVSVPLSELLEDTIITNLHQRKISAVEEALAYARWLKLTGSTQKDLSARIGKKESDISNILKLLKLDENILTDLALRKMSRVLGQQLASYHKDRQQEMREEYDKILDGLGGKIPSSNPSGWVAKTLRMIAEEKGIEPLESKRGKKMRPFSEMVFTSTKRAIKKFNQLLDELDKISRGHMTIQEDEARLVISGLRYFAENIEDTCLKLKGRLDR